MDILKARNYDKEDKFAVLDDGYIRALGNFYNESNLELFKDMFIVRTVLDAEPLLDEECANEYYKNHVEKEDSTEKDQLSHV